MERKQAISFPDNTKDHYVNNPYRFPPDDINPTEKGYNWCLQFANAIMNQHFMGMTVFPYGTQDDMLQKRAYMNGKQSAERYYPRIFRPAICSDKQKLADRLGAYQSNWRIMPIIPQAIDYIKSKFDDVDYKVVAKSINPLVNDMKEKKEFEMLAQGMIPKDIYAGMAAMGIEIPQETIIRSPEEMNMFKSIGGLKPAVEYVAQMLINAMTQDGDWTFTHNLCVEDIACFNKAILKDTIDHFSGRVYPEYVDPVNFIGLLDNRSSASDFCYAGHIKLMSVKTIREILKQQGRYSADVEKKLMSVCQIYQYMYSNRFLFNSSSFEYSSINRAFTYDLFHVPVADLEYKTINTEYRKYRTNSNGKIQYLRTEWGSEGDDIVKNSKEYFYKALLVINTDLLVDYGKASDQQREGLTKVRSSFHMVTSPNPSIVERAIPVADDVAVDYIKYQHDSAQARPNGLAISKSALEGYKQDGNNLTEGEALDMMLSSSKVIWNDLSIVGSTVMNNAIPIKLIEGGMGIVLQEYHTKYQFALLQMGEILNIKRTEALPRVAVQVAQMAEQQTDRGISELTNMMNRLKERAFSGCYKRLKLAIKNNKDVYNSYYPLVGRTSAEVIKMTADISDEDMGIYFVAKPRNFEVQADLDRLTQLAQPTASGLPPMEASTYYAVRDAILNGDIEIAKAYMIAAEAKRNELQQAISDRNQQVQAQVQQQIAAMNAQLETQMIWEKAKAENWLKEQDFLREQKKSLGLPQTEPQLQVA